MSKLKLKQKVYYARISDTTGTFEVLDLKIRTIEDDWFVGIDDRTKHAYLLGTNTLNKEVFFNRQDALDLVLAAEKNCKKKFTSDKYYEEY